MSHLNGWTVCKAQCKAMFACYQSANSCHRNKASLAVSVESLVSFVTPCILLPMNTLNYKKNRSSGGKSASLACEKPLVPFLTISSAWPYGGSTAAKSGTSGFLCTKEADFKPLDLLFL